jgi:hypothetical protein
LTNKLELILITFGACLIIGSFIALINANNYISTNYDGIANDVYSGMIGVANGVIIFIFTEMYKIACFKVNDLQNFQLQSEYESNYIFKISFFDFVLSYINLAYYAFYLRDFKLLANNFITIIISKNLLFAIKVG